MSQNRLNKTEKEAILKDLKVKFRGFLVRCQIRDGARRACAGCGRSIKNGQFYVTAAGRYTYHIKKDGTRCK